MTRMFLKHFIACRAALIVTGDWDIIMSVVWLHDESGFGGEVLCRDVFRTICMIDEQAMSTASTTAHISG
jgi:hypothetical protein